ncbi:MAG: hypothetical protein HOP20_10415 [Sulfuriferula sp.]|nr:hypothetical protein [Sulfuriferula sp.]
MVKRIIVAMVMVCSAGVATAGQTPGAASPWNGPWGNGYLGAGPYPATATPYISAGYPLAQPYSNQIAAPQVQYLPGGGYILPPSEGGGMLPNAYTR